MAFEVNKCCFCVELRTGSLIIGYLNLVWNIIVTLLVIVSMAAVGVAVSSISEREMNEEKHTIAVIAMVVFGAILLFLILNLIFIIVLLVGLHKNKRGHVKAYLIYAFIFILFAIVMFISSIARGNPAGDIIKNLLTLLFTIYFFVVIRSYYLKMNDTANKPAVYNTA
ncbi:unnamed protein product [Arctia plantaginis]|uniref:Uncharacterized protein n=1 Tax=Arctia plantaginis TaxID=874455 RepID=A0A8S0Z5P2_ARCPL|nr:unnamed protein product [Arctia plantaginis]CAB3228273.1 unnamed protein product [Arctia plantaginis]